MRLIAAVLVFVAFWCPALADDGRKIDFTQVILNQDEEPITECADHIPPKDDRDCKVHRDLTLGMIALRALTFPEQGMGQDESLKRGQLGLMLYRSPGAELKAEEITLLKDQIRKTYGPLIVGITFPILDPAVKRR